MRQKKTGNKEVKIFADILFLWTVNGVCLVSCLLNPKVDLRPSFTTGFNGNSPTRADMECKVSAGSGRLDRLEFSGI